MIICCDVDGIINDLMPVALDMYNKQFNKNISINDITTYNFYDCLEKEDADNIRSLFKDKQLWDSLTPLKGSQDGIKKIIDMGHKFYLVTATAPENFYWKVQWIENFFPFIEPNHIIRMMDKSLLNTDILIDDCMDNLTKVVCERICLDYLWNQDENKDYVYDIHRCYNWDDIIKCVKQITKEVKKDE